jgi:hypothetical protein
VVEDPRVLEKVGQVLINELSGTIWHPFYYVCISTWSQSSHLFYQPTNFIKDSNLINYFSIENSIDQSCEEIGTLHVSENRVKSTNPSPDANYVPLDEAGMPSYLEDRRNFTIEYVSSTSFVLNVRVNLR